MKFASRFLNGKHVRIALGHMFPTALRKNYTTPPTDSQQNEPVWSDIAEWEGGAVELIRLFQQRANFTCSIVQDAHDISGIYDPKAVTATGNWTGMLGLLLNNSADVLFQGLQNTTERGRDFLFSVQAYTYEPYIIVYHGGARDLAATDWMQITRPFNFATWFVAGLLLLLTIILTAVMEIIMEKRFASDCKALCCRLQQRVGHLTAKALEEALRHFTNRGPEIKYRSISAKLVIVVWALFSVVLSALYPVQLFSILTAPKLQREVFMDLTSLRLAGYKIAARLNSTSAAILSDAINQSGWDEHLELRKSTLPEESWPREHTDMQRLINDTTSRVALFLPLNYYKNHSNILCNPMSVINLQEGVAVKRGTRNSPNGFDSLKHHLSSSPENRLVFRLEDVAMRNAFDELILWARMLGFVTQIERKVRRAEQQQQQLRREQIRNDTLIAWNSTGATPEQLDRKCTTDATTISKQIFDYQTGLRIIDDKQYIKARKAAFRLESIASALAFWGIGLLLGFAVFLIEFILG